MITSSARSLLFRRAVLPSKVPFLSVRAFASHTYWSQQFLSTDSTAPDVATLPPLHEPAEGPTGNLWELQYHHRQGWTQPSDWLDKEAKVRRTFGPRSNAQALVVCGGDALAAHASFDPEYNRAQGWIRAHPIGPAVLSPILITGLVGALVEATFPQAITRAESMQQIRPLIVGVAVEAKILVTEVLESTDDNYRHGYQVHLETKVCRVRDDALIAQGTHTVWIPDLSR